MAVNNSLKDDKQLWYDSSNTIFIANVKNESILLNKLKFQKFVLTLNENSIKINIQSKV